MFSDTSDDVIAANFLRSFSISAPFLPIITPGRAAKIEMRHSFAGRSITTLEIAACGNVFTMNSRMRRSSSSKRP